MKWFGKKKKTQAEVEALEVIADSAETVAVAVEPVAEEVKAEPVEIKPVAAVKEPTEADLKPLAPKVFIVNCNKCGAAVKAKDGAYVYICGSCKNLFQIRKMEKYVKEIKPVIEPVEETKAWDGEPVEELKEEPVQLEIPVEEISVVDEMETDAAAEATEEVSDVAEVPASEEKEEPAWMPETDAGEEDGWEDDNRHGELPVWKEDTDEEEDGWDEE